MASVLEKLAKRRCYPITVQNGEPVHVRALTFGELRALESLPQQLSGGFIFGVGVVTDTGEQAIPILEGETHQQFAERVSDILVDHEIPTDTLRDVNEAIIKLMKVPPVEDIAKN